MAVAAIWLSNLRDPFQWALTVTLLAGLSDGIRRVLRPALQLRLQQAQLEYRLRPDQAWRRQAASQSCFASPWFIGWRGRGLRGHGVFRCQLQPEQFRRLLVSLRHQSSP